MLLTIIWPVAITLPLKIHTKIFASSFELVNLRVAHFEATSLLILNKQMCSHLENIFKSNNKMIQAMERCVSRCRPTFISNSGRSRRGKKTKHCFGYINIMNELKGIKTAVSHCTSVEVNVPFVCIDWRDEFILYCFSPHITPCDLPFQLSS